MIYYIREYVCLSVSKLFYVQYFARVRYKNNLNEVVETETTLKNFLYCNITKVFLSTMSTMYFQETKAILSPTIPKLP